MCPSKLTNPSTRRTPVNYSIELRIQDMIEEKAHVDGTTNSEALNEILKHVFGIVD